MILDAVEAAQLKATALTFSYNPLAKESKRGQT
jgi:hypothetical protein